MSIVEIFQTVGLLMFLVAHLGMRRASDNASGRTPFFQAPWDNRPWFSPVGYWMQLVGWVFLVGGLLAKVASQFS